MDFKAFLLEQGISEEQATAVIDGMAENKFFLTGEEKLDERYEKLKQQKAELQNDLAAANTLVDDLKKSSKDSQGLQDKISSYKTQIEELNQQREQDRKDSAIEMALKENKAKNTKAIKALVDLEKVQLSENGLEGLDDQLKKIKETDAYLFDQKEKSEPTKQVLFEGNPSGTNDSNELTMTQRIAQRMAGGNQEELK